MPKKTKTYSNKIFARNFETLMFVNRLTLREIAQRTSLPLSTISTWKRGRVPRAAKAAKKLGELFGVPLETLASAELPQPAVFANQSPPRLSGGFRGARRIISTAALSPAPSPPEADPYAAKIEAHISALLALCRSHAEKRALFERLAEVFPLEKKRKKRLRKPRPAV